MSEANPYQTPQSNLEDPQPVNPQLNSDWDIGDVFKEAWSLTNGFKGTFICAMLINFGVSQGLSRIAEKINNDSIPFIIITQLLIAFITYPLSVGLTMLGIKRAVGLPTKMNMIFDYYPKIIQIFLLYMLMILLICLGTLLLIIPGIYLAIAYSMAMPLMIEKNMGIWDALETSRKTIHNYWFNFFGLYLVLALICIVSLVPLGIGLIWAMPFCVIVLGIVYRSLFGISQSA